MRVPRITVVAALLSAALVAVTLVGCSSSTPATVLASATISAATGGKIQAGNGVALEVPAGVLKQDSVATITDVGDGKYDVHIAGDWSGKVAVTMPLQQGKDAVAHQIAGQWVMEGTDYAQSTVWVTQLSVFSTIRDAAIKLLCKAFGNQFVPCLIGKGIQFVDAQLALWIAHATGNTCAAVIIATIIGGDPRGNRFIKLGQVLIKDVFDDACSSMAGETQDYINAHIDWNGNGIPDAQETQAPTPPQPQQQAPAPPQQEAPQQPAQQQAPAPAAPQAPVQQQPAPPAPAAPAPLPEKAWVDRSGDTITYHWQSIPSGMWDQVDRFRCWRYTQQTHPHGWETDGCGQQLGFAGYPSGTGQLSFTVPGATDSFSIEPWKYGPWLNVGQVWQP